MIRPSRPLILSLALLTLLAVLAISASGISWLLKVLLIALCVVGMGKEVHSMLRPRWVAVDARDSGLGLWQRSSSEPDRLIVSRTFVSPLFLGMTGRLDSGERVRLGLFRGQLDDDRFRRLAVALREAGES